MKAAAPEPEGAKAGDVVASYGSASHHDAYAAPELEASMTYVYILQSVALPERYYVGITGDLRSRLQQHNAGAVPHTPKYASWKIKTCIAFSDEKQAFAFERYLKSPSRRAFAKKRL